MKDNMDRKPTPSSIPKSRQSLTLSRAERAAAPSDSESSLALSKLQQNAIDDLHGWAARFEHLAETLPSSEAARHHLIWSLSHEGVALVALAVECDTPDDLIRAAIAPAVAVQRRSPFARRLKEWPRGYPGDFETIEYLCRQENRAAAGTAGWYIEAMTLNTPIAQQHRNKVLHQARLLAELAIGKPYSRVLIVAVGSAPDVRQALPLLEKSQCRIVLNDMDADALDFCRARLSGLGNRVDLVHGNVLRCFRRLAELGPFDLVLCGGLFDYLTGRQVALVLRRINALFAAGNNSGRLFFTNIASKNPYRLWMEYFANWRLIERDADEILDLLDGADFNTTSWNVVIERDATGLAWMVEVAGRDSEFSGHTAAIKKRVFGEVRQRRDQ